MLPVHPIIKMAVEGRGGASTSIASAGPSPTLGASGIDRGPGTCFKKRTGQLGIETPIECPCIGTLNRMNEFGIEGCRRHLKTLVAEIKQNARSAFPKRFSKKWWRVIYRAIRTGIAFRVSWRDPVRGLVLLAIRDAAREEKSC